MRGLCVLLSGFGILMLACSGGGGVAPGGASVQSGCDKLPNSVIRGKVSKADGTPLSAADIRITNNTSSLSTEQSYNAKTDAQGAYCQVVKAGGNSYNIFPSYTLNWQGMAYTFDLHPRDNHPPDQRFQIDKPVVQDFDWQIQGAGHGGTIQGRAYDPTTAGFAPRTALPAGSTVELSLQPSGPLVDGSTGQAQAYRLQFPPNGTESQDIADVPVGAYTATARLRDAAGNTSPLLVTAQYNHLPPAQGAGYVKPVPPAATTAFYFDTRAKLGSVAHGPLEAALYFVVAR